ncbi:translocation protein, Sec62 family, partial [Necator americanus]
FEFIQWQYFSLYVLLVSPRLGNVDLFRLSAATSFNIYPSNDVCELQIISMSTKRKGGKKEESGDAALSKEQDAIARYVRFNCPTLSTMFQGNEVYYFSGSKAVDTLMESKYGAKAKSEAATLFPNRQAAVNYMRDLMAYQLFFRARKLVPKKKDEKDKKGRKKKREDETLTETEAEDKKEEKKTKESKIFNDDKDVYVWVFDPTPLYKKVIGLLMVLGTIVGCLFPLWPIWLRQGVYYLSLAGIGLFGVIVVVAILRTILFGIIWLVTRGEHKLWILPNLTEDCGFFESFRPWYTYEYCPRGKSVDKDQKKKKKRKEKESDDEKEGEGNKQEDMNEGRDELDNVSKGSNSENEEVSVSEDASSAPPSPQGEVRKRRSRRADADYVIVKK